MSRYAAKTYGRSQSQKLCSASTQFDQIFGDQSNKPSTKVSPTFHKWGQTSFKPVRSTQVNGQRDTPEVNVKRGRIGEGIDDPFSFDSDEDLPGSPLKHRVPAKSITAKAYSLPPVHHEHQETDAFIKTYTRKTNILLEQSKSILPSDQKKQTTMDTFVTKQTSDTKIKLRRSPAKPGSNLNSQDNRDAKDDIWSLIISGSSSNSPVGSVVNITDSKKESSDSEIEFNLPKLKENFEKSISDIDDDDDDKIAKTFSDDDNQNRFSDNSSLQAFSDDGLEKPSFPVIEDKVKSSSLEKETSSQHVSDEDINLLQPFSSDDDDDEEEEETNMSCKSPVQTQGHSQPDEIKTYSAKEKNLGIETTPGSPEILETETNDFTLPINSVTLKRFASDPLSSKSILSNRTSVSAATSGGSFFSEKPRRIFYSPKKAAGRAVYNHRTWQDDHDSTSEPMLPEDIQESSHLDPSANIKDRPLPLIRHTSLASKTSAEGIISISCRKEKKELYTVVRNVKQAHQCHESGETQEMNDDIDYLLEGLQSYNSMGTRCLSVISLATKCMAAAFRMHLRAHGTIPKIFSALHDAPADLSLALCTASVMFILSRDRLNMDLDRSSLDLMLQLLGADYVFSEDDVNCSQSNRDYIKTRQSVCKLCEQLQSKGFAKHLNLENVSTGYLAMETLLSLTSRKAGEWFKEELRLLGGLDHIIDSVSGFVESLPETNDHLTELQLDGLGKVDRCLRVLENVTFMNTDNQAYLLTYKHSSLIASVTGTLQFCQHLIPVYPFPEDKTCEDNAAYVLYNSVLDILRVLLNLTHDNDWGSTKVGEQDGLMRSVLICILQVPHYIPPNQRFDLLVLGLGLLINLVEHCDVNKSRLISTKAVNISDSSKKIQTVDAIQALVQLFLIHESAAQAADLEDSLPIPSSKDSGAQSSKDQEKPVNNSEAKNEGEEDQIDEEIVIDEEDISFTQDAEETITMALHKAGKHMEDSIVASYVALLLGCVIQNCKDYADLVRQYLPDNSFDIMTRMLQKFLQFMDLTSALGTAGSKNIATVIDVLEAS